MSPSAKRDANSKKFDAAAALLADDLRTTSQDFEAALQAHIWNREYGGFESIRDGPFFEEQLKDFLSAIERILKKRFREIVSIASHESEITLVVESATAIVTSAVREHCNPESILLRAFPDLTGKVIDLPPSVGPLEASDPVEAICSRIRSSLNNSIDRSANQTLVDVVSNAELKIEMPTAQIDAAASPKALPGSPTVPSQAEPMTATVAPTVNTSPKPGEPPAVEKLAPKKQDLSKYLDGTNLTAKQRECASLKWEYELSYAEIARRLGVHRKTVDEHICAAKKKMDQSKANEKHAKDKAKSGEP